MCNLRNNEDTSVEGLECLVKNPTPVRHRRNCVYRKISRPTKANLDLYSEASSSGSNNELRMLLPSPGQPMLAAFLARRDFPTMMPVCLPAEPFQSSQSRINDRVSPQRVCSFKGGARVNRRYRQNR